MSMNNLSLLLPALATKPEAWTWGTVTQEIPLRVRLDGDLDPLDVTPDCLFGNPINGMRVWVQRFGRRTIVHAPSGGVVAGPTGGTPVDWLDITGKPLSFPAMGHQHAWSDLTSVPTTFAPSTHAHAQAEVTGLVTALAGKAVVGHTHLWADLTDKPATFDPAAHMHTQADVTGLVAALSNKVDKGTTIDTGLGLTGGGDLTTNRTIDLVFGTSAQTPMRGNTRLDQIPAPTAAVALNGQRMTGAATPSLDSDLATKGYVDSLRPTAHINPSFETTAPSTAGNQSTGTVASREMPTNWDWGWSYPATAGSYPALSVDEAMYRVSGKSLKIDYTGTNNINQYLWSSPFAVAPGSSITVSAWVRGSSASMLADVGIITANDANPSVFAAGYGIQSTASSASNGVWTRLTGTFIMPEGHTYARLQVRGNNQGSIGTVWFDDTDSSITTTPVAQVLSGTISMWPTATAPQGHLILDGSEKPVATYPILDGILGTTYGARTNGAGGAGTTHFRLPDFRGRSPLGAGTASPAVTGGTAHTLGQKGGEETHLLTGSESGTSAHPHGITQTAHSHGIPGGFATLAGGSYGLNTPAGIGVASANYTDAVNANVSVNNATAANAASAHNTMHPYLGINYIIKT